MPFSTTLRRVQFQEKSRGAVSGCKLRKSQTQFAQNKFWQSEHPCYTFLETKLAIAWFDYPIVHDSWQYKSTTALGLTHFQCLRAGDVQFFCKAHKDFWIFLRFGVGENLTLLLNNKNWRWNAYKNRKLKILHVWMHIEHTVSSNWWSSLEINGSSVRTLSLKSSYFIQCLLSLEKVFAVKLHFISKNCQMECFRAFKIVKSPSWIRCIRLWASP